MFCEYTIALEISCTVLQKMCGKIYELNEQVNELIINISYKLTNTNLKDSQHGVLEIIKVGLGLFGKPE